MNEQELAKAKELARRDIRDLIRYIAPRHGVDPEPLLKKLPSLPVDPDEPGQLLSYMGGLTIESEGLTPDEAQAMTIVSFLVFDTFRDVLAVRRPRAL